MNQKLRDLQIQAFDECKTFEDGQFRTDEVFERFAQLIVEECADYIRTNYDSWDAEPLAFNMEKDFGLHGDYA